MKKTVAVAFAVALCCAGCTTNIHAYQSTVEVQGARDLLQGDPAVSVGGLTTPGLTIDKRCP